MGGHTGRRSAAVAPPTVGDITIYIAQDPVDFRLGINGLSTLVEATLKFDPFSRNLFCFVNKRRNQIKVLYWQRSGFCQRLKRLNRRSTTPRQRLLPAKPTTSAKKSRLNAHPRKY